MYGQTRILFTMSRDGMIPPVFKRVNPRTFTPVPNTVIVAIAVGLLAGLVPLSRLANLTSIGTLSAFTVVSVAVMVLRVRQPDLPRTFRVPFYPVLPLASIVFCVVIIWGLPASTIAVFAIWVAVVLAFYLSYGIRHSRLEQSGTSAGDRT